MGVSNNKREAMLVQQDVTDRTNLNFQCSKENELKYNLCYSNNYFHLIKHY